MPPATASTANPFTAYVPYGPLDEDKLPDRYGSTYIPVDSWVYPAMTRLYSMGFLDTMFLGMRPWTRRSALHMLQESKYDILKSNNEEAQDILAKLLTEFDAEVPSGYTARGAVYGLESTYTRFMGIGGTPLRDSYHLGQTIANDYGRPYQTGFNNITGLSTVNEWGPFSLYVRGEYQHSPSAAGYSHALASQLSAIDGITYSPPNEPQDTIPAGPISAQNPFRLVEASLSVHLLGNEISGGKTDAWLGPGAGGAMAWSNNAENIYSFRVNRVEPLNIFLLSKLLGPMRYDFFIGSLKGHTSPNSPWVHSEMFSFRPTVNFEFGFQRTIIFGGEGHAPVTLHTFLKGFFDTSDTTVGEKYSRNDPGARYSDFNFSYRLPFVRKYATLYIDSIAHDDVTPPSAPRRAAYRTGLYISQFPKLHKLDLRVEGVTTDPGVSRSYRGQFNYFETIQLQGYTNKGYIMGDWIGREAKGGQAWLTYHLSGNEWVQLEYLNKKTPKDFIPGGTTQNQFKVSVVKRLGQDLELNGWLQYEQWKAPIYKPGLQKDTTAVVQFTWFPKLHTYPQY
ncbi:MAG TPA: capsule assembly Wzi family protein [Edaphobacter sp.]|uniref:capsule assembly Wzi family protein n=1 Tax=Edaphobacter sp. TaxID=1934404 RepID=UPI002C0B0124|nr:capsule assembly Wzi family protein [Edaphobacter sp.]HUZ94778.1 capsule assembly Wzi family protein [Edaphobacter sp.]